MADQPLIEVEIEGGDAVTRKVRSLHSALQNLHPFWRDVFAPKYFAMVQDLFATSGTPRGAGGRFVAGPWASLSPKYAEWKYANYPGLPILTRQGVLRNSLRWEGSGLGALGVWNPTASSVTFGTAVPYGIYHQVGTSKMPERPFLPEPDMEVFGPLLHDWILKHGTMGGTA